MCTKVLVILGGDLDTELVPLYRRAEQEGTLSIVGYAQQTARGLSFEGMTGELNIQRVLLSCLKLFPMIVYLRRYAPDIPRAALLDGRIFRMPGLDVPRLFAENIGRAQLQAVLEDQEEDFLDVTRAEIPRVWSYGSRMVSLGAKSYFGGRIEWGYRGGVQEIRIGSYTSFGPHVILEVGLNTNMTIAVSQRMIRGVWTLRQGTGLPPWGIKIMAEAYMSALTYGSDAAVA